MEDYRTVKLSRRERQIMDIIYQHGQMSVADVLENLPDAPSYSTVRGVAADFGGEGASHPPKRWSALHLSSDAAAPSGGPVCTQANRPDLLR